MRCWRIFRLKKLCKCRKRLIDKLVEECSENIDGNEMLYNEPLDVNFIEYNSIECL